MVLWSLSVISSLGLKRTLSYGSAVHAVRTRTANGMVEERIRWDGGLQRWIEWYCCVISNNTNQVAWIRVALLNSVVQRNAINENLVVSIRVDWLIHIVWQTTLRSWLWIFMLAALISCLFGVSSWRKLRSHPPSIVGTGAYAMATCCYG